MNIKDITKTKAHYNSEDEKIAEQEKALKNRVLELFASGMTYDSICAELYDRRIPIDSDGRVPSSDNPELKKLFNKAQARYKEHCDKILFILENAIIKDVKK